jgi:hypothetical protein
MSRIKFAAVCIILMFAGRLFSAAPPPPSTGGPGCWPPPCVPIDGGISFLIAAGAAYGVKKIRDSRKKSSNIS